MLRGILGLGGALLAMAVVAVAWQLGFGEAMPPALTAVVGLGCGAGMAMVFNDGR